MRVDKYHAIEQTIYLWTQGMMGYTIRRYMNATQWQPWEWVNPPMRPGVEYQTTERYMGKPVYVKVVNCGNGPDSTTKEILHPETPLTIINFAGAFHYGGDCLSMNGNEKCNLTVSHSRITIATTANYSLYTAFVWLKYTKFADKEVNT